MTRKERLAAKRQLARLLIARGFPAAQAHSDIGFMLNRAPVKLVKASLSACLNDVDPVASTLEVLAEVLDGR